MRTGIQPLGVHSPCFSRVTSAKIYTIFIRPKLEYGLNIIIFLVKNYKLLERTQDQCLRLAFGGHRSVSTYVFEHMTCLPSMRERVNTLQFKSNLRITFLPGSTLIGSLLPHIVAGPITAKFQWPKLLRSCTIWNLINTRTKYNDYLHWIYNTSGKVAPVSLLN